MTFPLQCVCDCPGTCKATGQLMTGITHTRCQQDARYRWLLSRRPKSEWPEELRQPPPPPSEKPYGLVKTVFNFLKSAYHHVKAGSPMSSSKELNRRIAICHQCPHLKVERCEICHCRVAYKASWNDQHCPINKW